MLAEKIIKAMLCMIIFFLCLFLSCVILTAVIENHTAKKNGIPQYQDYEITGVRYFTESYETGLITTKRETIEKVDVFYNNKKLTERLSWINISDRDFVRVYITHTEVYMTQKTYEDAIKEGKEKPL